MLDKLTKVSYTNSVVKGDDFMNAYQISSEIARLTQEQKRIELELDQAISNKENAIADLRVALGLFYGAKVLYRGEEYYVFKSQYTTPGENYVFWLTLTKLTKRGDMPKSPKHSVYCYATDVEALEAKIQ